MPSDGNLQQYNNMADMSGFIDPNSHSASATAGNYTPDLNMSASYMNLSGIGMGMENGMAGAYNAGGMAMGMERKRRNEIMATWK